MAPGLCTDLACWTHGNGESATARGCEPCSRPLWRSPVARYNRRIAGRSTMTPPARAAGRTAGTTMPTPDPVPPAPPRRAPGAAAVAGAAHAVARAGGGGHAPGGPAAAGRGAARHPDRAGRGRQDPPGPARRRRPGAQLANARTLFELGDLTKAEYLERRERLQRQIEGLRSEGELGEALDWAAAFLADLPAPWRAADDVQRNALARLLFSGGTHQRRLGCGTAAATQLRAVLRLGLSSPTSFRWKRTRDQPALETGART